MVRCSERVGAHVRKLKFSSVELAQCRHMQGYISSAHAVRL